MNNNLSPEATAWIAAEMGMNQQSLIENDDCKEWLEYMAMRKRQMNINDVYAVVRYFGNGTLNCRR